MKSTRRSLHSDFGFSIVELIAVIAVIAILIGLLVPALSQVQKMAATVSQKAQFSSISMGLETYREDMGDYPESRAASSIDFQGAQRLAEAMIGLDGFGFHPASVGDGDMTLYDVSTIDARKGPYLELDTANAVKLSSIYSSFPGTDSFILADKFKNVKSTVTGKKTGMPILYFKANTVNYVHPPTPTIGIPGPASEASLGSYAKFIYSYFDNRLFVKQYSPIDGSVHDMTAVIFYEKTANPNFSNPIRPHNNESFILLSAGPDGFYGTADDVYNFENGN